MRIGIDARHLINRRGIGTMVYHLVHALAELPGDYSYVLFTDHPMAKLRAPQDERFRVRLLTPKLFPIWEQIVLPAAAVSERLDVLHCLANTAPILLSGQIRLILTVHDVMYLMPVNALPRSPSLYQRLGRLYYRWCVPLAARYADTIVTVSEASRQDILRYLRVKSERVQVIREAANVSCKVVTDSTILDATKAKYGLRRPFVLALGAIDPRKNTARIIEAFARVSSRTKGRYQLVLVGLPSRHASRFRRLIESLGIVDEVVNVGFVPEEDLVALYNSSEMLLYPSLYEGFGLPILEAMACGTPVITSLCGALPEVCGAAALIVDPLNVDDIAAAMYRVASDRDLRRNLIARGHDQVQQFSWQRAASQTLDLYKSLRTSQHVL